MLKCFLTIAEHPFVSSSSASKAPPKKKGFFSKCLGGEASDAASGDDDPHETKRKNAFMEDAMVREQTLMSVLKNVNAPEPADHDEPDVTKDKAAAEAHPKPKRGFSDFFRFGSRSALLGGSMLKLGKEEPAEAKMRSKSVDELAAAEEAAGKEDDVARAHPLKTKSWLGGSLFRMNWFSRTRIDRQEQNYHYSHKCEHLVDVCKQANVG
jgi:hypothetical protein